jgi:hypothetical protein
LLQVVVGPRQVGKTTAVLQLLERLKLPSHVAAADTALPPGPEWIESQWSVARSLPARADAPATLVLDEIQKVHGWSDVVKRLWDEAIRARRPLRVILLGSSSLLLQRGLAESLAGRFLLHRCPHWSWAECREAFGWDLDHWLYFGGYPGAAPFANDEPLWKRYVADSLVEPAIARDVLQLQTVHKPSLLRHLFAFAAAFPGQQVSYTKMLGQLQDAGNTTTLAHYLKLLETAFLVSGLELYSAGLGGAPRKQSEAHRVELGADSCVVSPVVCRRAPRRGVVGPCRRKRRGCAPAQPSVRANLAGDLWARG